MELSEYQISEREKERIADLLGLLPKGIETALDLGARDGFISKLLAERYSSITALDLEQPSIVHDRIRCVKGDATCLDFPDASFDLVLCSEVLEHIPAELLDKACSEISRVSNQYVLIGVPYKQDIRVGRTTCPACGKINPPWGHVNSFDESRLRELFPSYKIVKTSFVGIAEAGTNNIACLLMDMAGNPYGAYSKEVMCIHCRAVLTSSSERTLLQKVLTKSALFVRSVQTPFLKEHPNWIHVLLNK